jgi:acyl carrier protein
MTQNVFLADPRGNNKRIYRTGDVGSLRPDGSFEFLGRKDAQVKLRGFRIELGEIETILTQHPLVREATVIVREDTTGLQHLIAYIVSKIAQQVPTSYELRYFLEEKLPDYMVPTVFIPIEAIPLTPNGKVNRRLLPVPEQIEKTPKETFALPKDILELQLMKVWEQVLGNRPIGIHDNFFDLGGHSLLAVVLANRIEKTFGKSLPLITLFQAPTIAQLADILRKEYHIIPWKVLEVIQPYGSKPPFFFICPTHYIRALAHLIGTDQPVYKLNLLSLQHSYKTIPSLEVVAKHYIEEIQTVQPEGPYYIGGFCGQVKTALEVAQQLRAGGHKVAVLILFQALPYDFKLKLYHHWHKFLRIGPKYILRKIQGKWRTLVRRSKHFLLGRLDKKDHKAVKIKKSSHELDYALFVNSFFSAIEHYEPKPYAGDVTFFFQKEWYYWHSIELELVKPMIKGEVKVFEVPAKERDRLLVPPQIEKTVEQLKHCLAEVVAKQTNLPPVKPV